MKLIILPILLFSLLSVSLSSSSSAEAAPSNRLLDAKWLAKPRPLNTGITIPDVTIGEIQGYKRIKATGAKFTRIIIFWSHVAPAQKPARWIPASPTSPYYKWENFDSQITAAKKSGLTPVIEIHAAPSWAERCHAPGEPGICDPNPDDFEDFVMATARRYNGIYAPKVRHWMPWNEPNLHIFFKPQRVGDQRPAPELYRELLKRFAKVIKNRDPNNIIIGGGLAPLGGKNSTSPLDFTRRLLCMQGRNNPKPIPNCNHKVQFDIWAINPYTTGGPTRKPSNPDDIQFGNIGAMVRLINAAKRAGKIQSKGAQVPVWITEFSWDSKGPDPNGLPMNILTRWVPEAMYRSWKVGIHTFFWFTLRDWEVTSARPFNVNVDGGLWYRGKSINQDKPKPILKSFKFPFVAFKQSKGILVWGKAPLGKKGRVKIFFSPNKRKWRLLKTVRANKYGIFYSRILTKRGKGNRGFLRARYKKQTSLSFSLKPVADFHHPPFG